MGFKLEKDAEKRLVAGIKRFAADDLDVDLGDLKARLLLDFFLRELGPAVHDQAIADAQRFLQEKVDDLGGQRFELDSDARRR